MGDREDELFDELLSYVEMKYADDNEVERRSDAIETAWVAQEALKRLLLADLRAKEEFGEIPAFEDTVDEKGNPVKVPNQALKRVLQEYSDMVRETPPWEQGSMAYNLMRERQELAEAWKNFGWKRQPSHKGSIVEQQKLRLRELEMIQPWGDKHTRDVVSLRKKRKEQKMPKLSKKEKAFLHKEDCAPDPRDIETYRTKATGAWVVYDAHEREHFELNKITRLNWDCLNSPGKRAEIEVEEFNSKLDVDLRDDMDMVLPDYPVHHRDEKAASEGYLALETLKESWDFRGYNNAVQTFHWSFSGFTTGAPTGGAFSWGRCDYTVGVESGFCHWLRSRGGMAKLLDLVDDVKYYIAHAPRFEHEPVVMLKGIKYQTLARDGLEQKATYLTQVGRDWHFVTRRGEPSNKFSTDHVVDRVKALVGRWLCDTDTLPTRINADRAGNIEPVGWDKKIPTYKEFKIGTRDVRLSCCSHCSNRLGERNSWYWKFVESVHEETYATQFRETGELGAYTLFVRDNVDCRWTQQKILGDQLFNSDDTWKIQGKSGDWKCLLCGRSKIFRGYFVRVTWISGPKFRFSFIDDGPYQGGQRLTLERGKKWSALVRLAGENVMDRVKRVCG